MAAADPIDPREDLLMGIVVRGTRRIPTEEQIANVERSAALFDAAAAAARDAAFAIRACGVLLNNAPGWPKLASLDMARRQATRSLGQSELGKWYRSAIAKQANEITLGLGDMVFASTTAQATEVELQNLYGVEAARIERLGFSFLAAAGWLRRMNQFSIADRETARAARKGKRGAVPQLNEQRMLREAREHGFGMTELARAVVRYERPKDETDEEREERALVLAKSYQKRLVTDGNAKK